MVKGYLGVELCLNVAKAFLEVKWVLDKYRRSLGDAVSWIYDQIERENEEIVRKTPNAWYVLAGSRVSEHIISNVISIVEKSVNPGKPVFAFADSTEGVKVSARARGDLVEGGLNLKKIVSSAAGKVGGYGGGHSGAAGATIPAGNEEVFINSVENDITVSPEEDKELNEKNNINPDSNPTKSDPKEVLEDGAAEEENKEDGGEKVEGEGLVQYFSS